MIRPHLPQLYGIITLCTSLMYVHCSTDVSPLTTSEEQTDPASVVSQTYAAMQDGVEGRYIVQFSATTLNHVVRAEELASRVGFPLTQLYRFAFKGFACRLTNQQIQKLKEFHDIISIEPDIIMKAFEQTLPTGIDRIDAELNAQASIDNTDTELDVDIAILDSGIDSDHPDLNVVGGRRFNSICLPSKGCISNEDDNFDDDNGHGTHCAGIAAARDNTLGVVGVAPGARLWAIKVLNKYGTGFTSDIIAGLDYIAKHADVIEVVNMSLGGTGQSNAYRTAIQGCVNAGVVVVVAAGNESVDICGADGVYNTADDVIPAAYPEVATISALADADGMAGGRGDETSFGNDDAIASFSNFSTSAPPNNPVTSAGAGIDMMLPGVDIQSTIPGGYAALSGTSMAAPHATGLVALHIIKHERATNAAEVYAIRQALIDRAVSQGGFQGLTDANQPDPNLEPLGWAGVKEVLHTDVAITTFQAMAPIAPGQPAAFKAAIQNRGTRALTNPLTVTIVHQPSGTVLFTKTLPSGLSVGQQIAGTITLPTGTTTPVGNHSVLCKHDLDDEVAYNNQKVSTLQIAQTVHVADARPASRP